MSKTIRQSNFELLKILAMLMIVSHHLIAKNYYNIDTDIQGISLNKLFLQFIGNHAFIGNNLFFMCSAFFLVDKQFDNSSYPKSQLKRIFSLERQMFFYSLGLFVLFSFILQTGGGKLLLFKSLFPLSSALWWYPTTYAVFLLIHPFYQKGLTALTDRERSQMVITMFLLWSVSTMVPLFDYGPSNFLCFIMLYALIFHIKKNPFVLPSRKMCIWIIAISFMIVGVAIILFDLIALKKPVFGKYSCYLIRGNYRVFPVVISMAIFIVFKDLKISSRLINYIASLTFGVYLIHMYPPAMDYLFSKQGSVFNLQKIISSPLFPLYSIFYILICFTGLLAIEMLRKEIGKTLVRIVPRLFNHQ